MGYLSITDYCNFYGVSRETLRTALHTGKINAIRESNKWFVKDEPIDDTLELSFKVVFLGSLYDTEYQILDEVSTYDEALYIAKGHGWVFETSAHGHGTDYYKLSIFVGCDEITY